jgi:Ribonuclease G/E
MQSDELPADGSPPDPDASDAPAPRRPDETNDDDAAAATRRPRRRRRRRAPGPAEDRDTPSEPEAGAFLDPPPPPPDPKPEGEAESEPTPAKPTRGRSRRRRGRRSRGGRGAAKKTATRRRKGAVTEEADADAPAPSESAPAPETPETPEPVEVPERGRRRRRQRRRRKSEPKGEPAAPVAAEPDVDVPPVADEAEASAEQPEAPSEARAKKARRARREGRKRTGRKAEGRRGNGRRDGRRRDPRAIDIVPRAPDPSEAAKEKILLVNAADREEARIALLVDGVLEEVYVETPSSERSSAGNIYRGRVQNVEPGIGAAFVDLGRGQTGFLHVSDLPLKEDEDADAAVTDRLQSGDEVIVQITRDSIGRKGPALTGRISFPGRYLVLMPYTDRSGISRRIPQGSERERVRKLLRKLEVPDGMGVIVRTASETTDAAALQADLEHLLKEWEYIKRKAAEPGQPGVLRDESDLAERSVRDIMPGDVRRIVVDKEEMAGKIHRLLRIWYPSAAAAAEEAAHAAVRTATAALHAPRGELETAPASDLPVEADDETGRPLDANEEPTSDDAEPAADEPPPIAADVEDDPPPDRDVETSPDADAELSSEGSDAAPPEPEAEVEGVDEAEEAEEIEEAEEFDETEMPEASEEAEALDEAEEPRETDAERLERLARMAQAMPDVELHTDPVPLFHRFGVETQLEDAFRRGIRLPSGGSIVIDPTEALVAVDVNSGRLTGEADPEATALVTNLEAVEEAARQLRLRDLGGLVVIDFIDMRDRRSRRKVEIALRDALSHDRARIRMGRMGPFGLVILSRQRIRQALSRLTHEACPACAGTGHRRLVSGLGMRVLREMQARVARSRGRGGLEVRAPQDVVAWIQKNRGSVIRQLRKACSGPVTLEADARLASDGWAMKGLPPSAANGEEED